MSGCWHSNHDDWCGGSPWWYEPSSLASPTRQPRRRREELEDYRRYLQEELKRVGHELEPQSNG